MPTFREFESDQVSYERKRVYTSDAVPFPLLSLTLQPGEGGRVILDVEATDDLGNKASFYWMCVVNRTPAGVVSVSAFTKVFTLQPAPMNTATLTATTSGDTANFNVIGIAAKNIRWQMIPDINTIVYVP